ncbi:MAG TPA: hypothetical protein VKA84_02990 [Gemmatimonadaceae bacterium]|nr:hypothetical protein [Gemmatimonadaceae bacterium]
MPSLSPGSEVVAQLRDANRAFAARYRGEGTGRQPVQVLYERAQGFTADGARRYGTVALRALEDYAPDWMTLARAVGLPESRVAESVYARVVEKLRREPVEELRVDFEDGYGVHPDGDEDALAAVVAGEMAVALEAGTLPPFPGVRVKPLTEAMGARGLRTLGILVHALLSETGGRLPPGFGVTLAKVTVPEQVTFLADALAQLERALGLALGAVAFDVMVEAPQLVLDARGESALPKLLAAAGGRLTAAHVGALDYTAGCGIAPAHQQPRHGALDFLRHAMQAALAGTGVRLADGATAAPLPLPRHRPQGGRGLTAAQSGENRAAVHRAWRQHFEDVQHALALGFYQGWDLDPAQLPTRYAATFAFYLSGLDAAAARLRAHAERAARTVAARGALPPDDAAAGQSVLNFVLRAMDCGAVTEREASAATGLGAEQLRGRSFSGLVQKRGG